MPATYTPNLNLWKGARGDVNWDTYLNANLQLIDGALYVVPFGLSPAASAAVNTAAIQAAVDIAGPHVVYLPAGEYELEDGGLGYGPWKVAIMILNRVGVTIQGPGTIRVPDDTVPIVIAGSQRTKLRDFTIYGYWDSDALSAMPAVRISGDWADGTSDIDDVWIDGVTWRNTPNDAVIIAGTSATYLCRNVRITNSHLDEGLAFLLAYGVKGLTVDGLTVKHRTSEPPGPAGRTSQDEDIAIYSNNGVDSENITINNVTVHAHGTAASAYTGYPKIHLGTTTGRVMSNVALSNINIKDNIGTIANGGVAGWEWHSIIIEDADWDDDTYTYSSFKNLTLTNINLQNSGGVAIQAHDVQFANLSIDTIPAAWPQKAIASLTTNGAAGCHFVNTKISNWAAAYMVNLEGESIIFNGLRVRNCDGGFWAAHKMHISDFVFDDAGETTYGSVYIPADTVGVMLRNGQFKNSPFTALKEVATNRGIDCVLSGVGFYGNAVNTNIWEAVWRISDCPGLVELCAATALQGVTGGLLLPRVTTTERNAITGPGGVLDGLMVYNTTTSTVQRYIAGWADI